MLIINPTRYANFSNLFGSKTLRVSDNSSVHHEEFFTVHTTMVHVIQDWWQLANRIRILLKSCLQTCITYTVAVCTVKNSWWWTEEFSETYRFLFQNKFEKLVHLIWFIIRVCHDARSRERKMRVSLKAQYGVVRISLKWKSLNYLNSEFSTSTRIRSKWEFGRKK